MTREWVEEKLAKLHELLASRKDRLPEVRRQLRLLLDGPIAMKPTIAGERRHYVATVKGKPLAILQELAGVTESIAPRGIEPRFGG